MSIKHGIYYSMRRSTLKRNSLLHRMSLVKSTVSTEFTNDQEVWKTIQMLLPVRRFHCSITKHAIIDEKNPFTLFAVELESEFSRYVAKK